MDPATAVQFKASLTQFEASFNQPINDLLQRLCKFLEENQNLLHADKDLSLYVGALHNKIEPICPSNEEVNFLLERIAAFTGHIVISQANAAKAIAFIRDNQGGIFLDSRLDQTPRNQLLDYRDLVQGLLSQFHPSLSPGASLKKEILLEQEFLLRILQSIQLHDSSFQLRLKRARTNSEVEAILISGKEQLDSASI